MGFWVNFGMYIILIIGLILAITFSIILWVRAKKLPKINTTTKVINLLHEWTHGHAEGWLIEQTKTPNKLTRVVFYPTDLTMIERIERKIEPEIVIAKNVKTIPMGTMSSSVNILWIFPNTVDELFKKLPNLELKLKLLDKKEDVEKLIAKMEEYLSEFEKNNKEQPEKIEELQQAISAYKNSIELIQKEFKEISTKELFNSEVLRSELMFEMGNAMKTAYNSILETNLELNFGAISQSERKKLKEILDYIISYTFGKPKEEAKNI